MRREVLFLLLLIWAMALPAKETNLKFFHPFSDTSGHLASIIFEKKSGECLVQSKLIKREDAWRCIADGQIFDPCFAKHFGAQFDVICIQNPWSDRAVQITVSNSLQGGQHKALDMSRTFPWAIELSSGERCQAVNNEEFYDQLPVRYYCEQNQKLLGHLQRCETPWKMLRLKNKTIDTVEIKRAWF